MQKCIDTVFHTVWDLYLPRQSSTGDSHVRYRNPPTSHVIIFLIASFLTRARPSHSGSPQPSQTAAPCAKPVLCSPRQTCVAAVATPTRDHYQDILTLV